MNPLFNMFNQGNQNGGNSPFGLIQQFYQFRNAFQGDPRQKVQELLNSGQMTQDQFNRLSAMAQQFEQMLGNK